MCVWQGEWIESAASAQLSIIVQYKYQPIYHLIDENVNKYWRDTMTLDTIFLIS